MPFSLLTINQQIFAAFSSTFQPLIDSQSGPQTLQPFMGMRDLVGERQNHTVMEFPLCFQTATMAFKNQFVVQNKWSRLG